jgi:hypothetical protein
MGDSGGFSDQERAAMKERAAELKKEKARGRGNKERYFTFGFTQNANLDDGGFWPTSFAVSALDTDAEKTIATLVAKAVN